MTTSVIDRVLTAIKGSPKGTTSSQICDSNPDLNRGTVTSAVSKLKQKGLIKFDANVPPNQPLLLYPMGTQTVTKVSTPKTTPINGSVTPLMTVDIKQRILEVLKPFAKYADQIRKNKPSDKFVWLSATTQSPTVEVAPMDWFMDAQKLFLELQK